MADQDQDGRVLKKGMRRREREEGVGLGRSAPNPTPSMQQQDSSGHGSSPVVLHSQTLFLPSRSNTAIIETN